MESNKKLKTSPVTQMSVEISGEDFGTNYGSDSFDRFGDDLCELLLSYLTFKDKIALEDVSKQWKRTIYNKQRVLRVFSVHPIEAIPHLNNHYINDLLVPIIVKNFVSGFANNMNMRTIDGQRLKVLLTKCRNIRKVEFTRVYVDSPLLDLIGQYCPNLESIQLDIIGLEEEDIIDFGRKYGQNLKNIKFNNCRTFSPRDYSNKFCTEFGKKLLSYCHNIKSFQCEDISIINDKRTEFLPKLQSIDLRLRRSDAQHFTDFVNKYDNKLKKLKLFSSEIEFQTLRNTLQQVSRFRNIEDLDITFNLMVHNQGHPNAINDKLTEMAKNCPKISRFLLNINIFMTGTEFVSGNIWECLGRFVHLKQLDVTLKLSDCEESVEALKRLKNLTDLSIRCSKIGDPFFKDVDQFLPNLKTLQLNSDYDLSDTLMESVSKLKCLTKISLGSGNKALKSITDSGLSKLMDSCPLLRKMIFLSRPNITTQTVDKLIEFANKNWKYSITFYTGYSRVGDESLLPTIDMNAYTKLPQNLRVMIRSANFNPMAGAGVPHFMPFNEMAQNMMAHMNVAQNGGNINIGANIGQNAGVHVIELNMEPNPIHMPIMPIGPPLHMPANVEVFLHNHPLPPLNLFGPPPPPINFL